MSNCADFADVLLDSLFGLLDEPDAARLRDHLAGCPACQAALAQARTEQGLIGQAALKFREVPAFQAPADECVTAFSHFPPLAKATPAAPATPPFRSRSGIRWRRWLALGAAAAVLIALGTTYIMYLEGLRERQQAVASAVKEVAACDARLVNLEHGSKQDQAGLAAKVQGQFLHVNVLGPATYQPTASAPYRLTTQTPTGQAAPAHVTVKLFSRLAEQEAEQVLFSEEYETKGELRFVLPAKLAVKPGAAPRLFIEARSAQAKEIIEQPLVVEEPTFLTHLTLNKSTYAVGEVVFFRTVTLERYALTPVDRPVALAYTLQRVAGAKLVPFKEVQGTTEVGGIGGGELALTDDLAEGDYVLTASEITDQPSRVHTATRRLRVVRNDQPKLVVDRKQYNPGETIKAFYQGKRLPTGPAAAKQPVTVKATVKDQPVAVDETGVKALQLLTDAEGNARFDVVVPKELPPGDLLLEMQIHDGKTNDKVQQIIKVERPNLGAEFFPEGGDLVANVPNRVYFRLNVAQGMPLDLEGVVEDSKKQEVARVQINAGRQQSLGVVTFTPTFGEVYRFRLSAAGKDVDRLPMPRVVPAGVTLTVPKSVLAAGEALKVQVRDPLRGRLLIVASCRGRTVDQRIVQAGEGATDVTLEPVVSCRGVVRVTVYEQDGDNWRPAAERLVYRQPAKYLQLWAGLDKGVGKTYRPGDPVKMRIQARNESNLLTRAWLHAWVIDEAALDDHEINPPTYFHLTSELREPEDLENADILLHDGPEAARALDLFLGTQGWRRFVKEPVSELTVLVAGKEANKAAFTEQPALLTAGTRLDGVAERTARALQEKQGVLARETIRKHQDLEGDRDHAAATEAAARTALADYEQRPNQVLRYAAGWGLVAALILVATTLLVGVICLCVAVSSGGRWRGTARVCFASSFAVLLVCLAFFKATESWRTPTELAGADPSKSRNQLDRGLAFGLEGQFAQLAPRDQAEKGKVHVHFYSAAPPKAVRGGDEALLLPAAPSTDLSTYFRYGQAKDNDGPDGWAAKKGPSVTMTERFEFARTAEAKSAGGIGGGGGFKGAGSTPLMGKSKDGKGDKDKGGREDSHPNPPAGDSKKDVAEKDKATLETAVLREFAHVHSPTGQDQQDLVLWQPLLFAEDGTALVRFDLSGKATTYRILIYGHTANGRLGAYQGKIEAGR
jgi:anti-sigma factor RsiW